MLHQPCLKWSNKPALAQNSCSLPCQTHRWRGLIGIVWCWGTSSGGDPPCHSPLAATAGAGLLATLGWRHPDGRPCICAAYHLSVLCKQQTVMIAVAGRHAYSLFCSRVVVRP